MTKLEKINFILLLSLATFVMALGLSGLAPVSSELMREWQVTASNIQWLTTIFMLTMSLVMPLSPWLFNNLHFRALFAALLLLFISGTGLLILADNLVIALIGRVLQALALGVLFPSYQTALLVITSLRKRGLVMGIAGLTMSFAIAAGSFLTSIVMTYFNWRSLFFIYFLLMAVCLIISPFIIKNINRVKGEKMDLISVFEALGFAGLLYIVNCLKNPHLNWQEWLILLLSLILIVLFIRRQFHLPVPVLNLKCLKNINFDVCLLLSGIAYSSLIMVTTVFPIYYQSFMNINSANSGLALLWPALILALINPAVGYVADRIGFKLILLIGMILISVSYLFLALFAEQLSLSDLIVLTILIEAGTGFVMMPATTYGVSILPWKMMAHGTAIVTTVRQLMASLGSSFVAILLFNLKNYHCYLRIFSLFTVFNLIVLLIMMFLKKEEK